MLVRKTLEISEYNPQPGAAMRRSRSLLRRSGRSKGFALRSPAAGHPRRSCRARPFGAPARRRAGGGVPSRRSRPSPPHRVTARVHGRQVRVGRAAGRDAQRDSGRRDERGTTAGARRACQLRRKPGLRMASPSPPSLSLVRRLSRGKRARFAAHGEKNGDGIASGSNEGEFMRTVRRAQRKSGGRKSEIEIRGQYTH